MLTVFPFYVEGDYTSLTEGKYRIFLIICGGYVLLMSILSLREKRRLRWCGAEYCAAAYLAVTLLSAAVSPYPGTWLGNERYEGALTIAVYVLTFFFLSRYGRVKLWQLHLLGISVGVYSILCLLQIAGGNPLGLYPGDLGYADAGIAYNGAFLGTMGNAGLSGAWLSLSVPMLFAALLLLRREGRWLLLPMILGVLTVALMDVSAAVLGVAGSLLLTLPMLVSKKNSAMAKGITVSAFAVLILAIWFFSMPGTAGELHLLLHGMMADSFGSGRIGIWRQLVERIPRQWLLGSGADTVGLLGLVPFVGESAAGELVERAVDVAHNEYLQILICQGVFALAAYLGLLVTLCRRWRKADTIPGKILGCGILGYCIQAFFSFSMCITAPLFWLALGLLNAACAKDKEIAASAVVE